MVFPAIPVDDDMPPPPSGPPPPMSDRSPSPPPPAMPDSKTALLIYSLISTHLSMQLSSQHSSHLNSTLISSHLIYSQFNSNFISSQFNSSYLTSSACVWCDIGSVSPPPPPAFRLSMEVKFSAETLAAEKKALEREQAETAILSAGTALSPPAYRDSMDMLKMGVDIDTGNKLQ